MVGAKQKKKKRKKYQHAKEQKSVARAPSPPLPFPVSQAKNKFPLGNKCGKIDPRFAERRPADLAWNARPENRWFPPKRFSPFQQLSCMPANRHGSNDRASTETNVNAWTRSLRGWRAYTWTAARVLLFNPRRRPAKRGSITDNEVEVLPCKTAC